MEKTHHPWYVCFSLAPHPHRTYPKLSRMPPPSFVGTQFGSLIIQDHNCLSMYWLTPTLLTSVMSHLRTNCLHVHLSLRLLYDTVFRNHFRHSPDCILRRHDHLCVRLRRIFIRSRLGSNQRQVGKEAGPYLWTGRNSN